MNVSVLSGCSTHLLSKVQLTMLIPSDVHSKLGYIVLSFHKTFQSNKPDTDSILLIVLKASKIAYFQL